MKLSNKEFIASGILEQYVMGITTPNETEEVMQRAAADAAIRMEIESISKTLEDYAMRNAVAPNAYVKPFLIATIDYTERLTNGEVATFPPALHKDSKIADFEPWLNRPDMTLLDATEDLYAKIIGTTQDSVTAIVWIKDYAPQEVHDNEHERFLIIEGTCNIIVAEEVHALVAGDYFAIPLHKHHMIQVTSAIPCKAILQRVAA